MQALRPFQSHVIVTILAHWVLHLQRIHAQLYLHRIVRSTHLLTSLGLLKRLGNGSRGDVRAGRLERADGLGELRARKTGSTALLGSVVWVVGGGRVGLDGELWRVSVSGNRLRAVGGNSVGERA